MPLNGQFFTSSSGPISQKVNSCYKFCSSCRLELNIKQCSYIHKLNAYMIYSLGWQMLVAAPPTVIQGLRMVWPPFTVVPASSAPSWHRRQNIRLNKQETRGTLIGIIPAPCTESVGLVHFRISCRIFIVPLIPVGFLDGPNIVGNFPNLI